jgi:hypothetical protein
VFPKNGADSIFLFHTGDLHLLFPLPIFLPRTGRLDAVAPRRIRGAAVRFSTILTVLSTGNFEGFIGDSNWFTGWDFLILCWCRGEPPREVERANQHQNAAGDSSPPDMRPRW